MLPNESYPLDRVVILCKIPATYAGAVSVFFLAPLIALLSLGEVPSRSPP